MPPRSAPLSIAGIVLLAIAAEGLLTLMDAMIKALSPRYPTFEIAFLRFAFGMVGAVAYWMWTRSGWPTRETHSTTACARSSACSPQRLLLCLEPAAAG